MCGIWAIFGSDNYVGCHMKECLKIAHRGPNATRLETVSNYPNCMFGFHRLAILDELHGMQPFRLHQYPHLWLCYNGEIYNHQLLRKDNDFQCETECDGEVIVHMYAKYGMDTAIKHLDGVFGLCLLDTNAGKVYIGRDTVGVKPLFIMLTGNQALAVSSEAKGISKLDITERGPVAEVLPGRYMEFDLKNNGKVELVQDICFHKAGDVPLYRSLVEGQDSEESKDDLVDIQRLLTAAVRKRMMGQKRIGCMLSGGLDSSLIAALANRERKNMGLTYPLQTFSIGMEGSPDLSAAKKVADFIGSEHHEVIVSAREVIDAIDEVIYFMETYDPLTLRGSICMYLLSKYIRENTDNVVILSGEGSDEVAQGYIYFHQAPSAEAGDEESRRLIQDLHCFDVLRADKTTSAHGLELRVPFLDHRFVAHYLCIPAADRQPRDGMEKYMIRKAFSEEGLLPSEILWRPKEGFSDGFCSQKKSLYEILQDNIDERVKQETLEQAHMLYPFNTPRTKESLYYRQVFEKYFPGMSHWCPYFWMPKWVEASDPSARVLKHYKQ